MKKRLLSIFAMVCVTLSMQAAVGDDLTSTYLQNADFSQDTPVKGCIYTYAKDMASAGALLYGMQPVIGWVASNPTDNVSHTGDDTNLDMRASGVFGIGKYDGIDHYAELGGAYYCPDKNSAGQDAVGNALGMVSVWGGKLQYTQAVTLPAGCYTLKFVVANTGGSGTVSANLMGFFAEDGTSYVVDKKSWEVGSADYPVWSTDEVTFLLDKATTGVISVGYTGPGGSGAMPHLFVDYVKIEEGDAVAFDLEKAAVLKETLAELIEQADELSIDVTAYQEILDNPNATSAQVQAAIDELRDKIANAMTDFTDFFINNAHFAIGTPMDNGVCTYDYDMAKNNTTYYGMQPIPDWTALTPTDNTLVSTDSGSGARKDGLNAGASGLFAVGSPETVWLGSAEDKVPATKANGATEGNVFGFISVWSKNSYYYQEVTLPAGSYTITIPTYNERGTGAIAKNMCGFIAENGDEYLATTTTFPVGVWKEETIKFKLEDETSGRIVIGYEAANAGSKDMPHLFIDEFLLKFNGKTDVDPSLLALNSAIRAGEAMLDTDEMYEAALEDDLQAALEAGQALKDAGSSNQAANTAAATAINNAVGAVRSSIAVYKNFRNFIDGKLSDTYDKYYNTDLSDFANDLIDDKDIYVTAWEEGTYTTEQINEIINGFDARVIAAVKAVFEIKANEGGSANLDITCLFADKNLGYVNSNVDGWKNETGTDKFLSRVQTAEVWGQASFNVYQTLENLPAGVYEISAGGFYRSAANVDNYSEWQNDEVVGSAYIYAGNNKTLMHNVAEVASEDQTNRSGDLGNGLWVPNSNDNAHYFFYDQNELDVNNTVSGVLAAPGTLTLGVKGVDLESNAWVVWGGFTVVYKGTDGMEAALAAEVEALSEEASALADYLNGMVQSADSKLNEAISGAEDVDEGSSIADLTAAINALNEAIAYANESLKLLSDIEAAYVLFSNLMDEVESNDNSYFNLIDEVAAAMEDSFDSNEAITTYINRMKDEWAAFVQHDVIATATEAKPADISAAILNRGFEGITEGIMNPQDEQSGAGSGAYWDKTRDGGSDFGYQFGIYESYNTNWFEISQTLKGLAAGYYKVTVQGFYREGSNQDNANAYAGDSLTTYVSLFANDYSVKLNNQLENGTNGELAGVGDEPTIEYNGNAEYHVPNTREALAGQFEEGLYMNELVCKVAEDGILRLGICKKAGVAGDWCPFDNFKLFYLGTTISDEPVVNPTAIETVEAENAANTVIFDLAGRRVAKAVKGIYIINGKKVVK